jgi:hypothetical protein
MEHISSIIIAFIEENMKERGLSPYRTDDEKILVLDGDYATCFKFDIVFSDNDFSCSVLSKGENGLHLRRHFNISWTNAAEIREFMEFVRAL